MAETRLVIRHLCKSYATPVLSDVSLSIAPGEIYAIVGENGAGKTTLVNILAGLTAPDSGELVLDDAPYEPRRPRDAFDRGVSFAAQELSTIPTLTVAENLQLRRLPAQGGVIARGRLRAAAARALEVVGLAAVDADTRVRDLPVSDRQLLEFAKATIGGPGLLMLDEPTAALTKPEADHLHGRIRELAGSGVSVIYISHRLDDVLGIADRVSVLRDGRLVAEGPAGDFTTDSLVRHMAGDTFPVPAAANDRATGEPLLGIRSVTTKSLPHPIDLTLSAGEIAGLAGLAGAGRSELLHAAFGLVTLTGGAVLRHVDGSDLAMRSPRAAVAAGVALLGEDRQSMGLYAGQSVLTNMMLPGRHSQRRNAKIIDRKFETAAAAELVRKLGVRCAGPGQDIAELSGGNQQKALLARWIHCESAVYLLDEPTRGVDVATKAAIHALLRELAAEGRGILLASSEIEELMTVCDRIVVLSNRKVAATFTRPDWSEAEILGAAFSGHSERVH